MQFLSGIVKCQVSWDAADSACECADIPVRVLRRPLKLNSRLAGTLVDASVEADNAISFQTFKRNIFAVTDKMLCEINRRFSECSGVARVVEVAGTDHGIWEREAGGACTPVHGQRPCWGREGTRRGSPLPPLGYGG